MKKIIFSAVACSMIMSLASCGMYGQYAQYDDAGRHSYYATPQYGSGYSSPYAYGYNAGYNGGRPQSVGQALTRLVLATGAYVMASAVENAIYSNGGYGYPVYCNEGNYYSINRDRIAFPVYLGPDKRFYDRPYTYGPHNYYDERYAPSRREIPAAVQTLRTEQVISLGLGGYQGY